SRWCPAATRCCGMRLPRPAPTSRTSWSQSARRPDAQAASGYRRRRTTGTIERHEPAVHRHRRTEGRYELALRPLERPSRRLDAVPEGAPLLRREGARPTSQPAAADAGRPPGRRPLADSGAQVEAQPHVVVAGGDVVVGAVLLHLPLHGPVVPEPVPAGRE